MRYGFRNIVLAAALTAAPALASRVSGEHATLQLGETLGSLAPDAGLALATGPETSGEWNQTVGIPPALVSAPLPERRDDSLLHLADWSYTVSSVAAPAQTDTESDSAPVETAPLLTPQRESLGIAALAIALLLWRNLAPRKETGKRREREVKEPIRLMEMRGPESAFGAAGVRKV
jgi:hypothetical protein